MGTIGTLVNYRVCSVCGVDVFWKRCKEHMTCDGCGEREGAGFSFDGVHCSGCFDILMAEQIANFNEDTNCQPVPVCPHCGNRLHDWWDLGWAGDEDIDASCNHCGNDYHIEMIKTIEFTTTKV